MSVFGYLIKKDESIVFTILGEHKEKLSYISIVYFVSNTFNKKKEGVYVLIIMRVIRDNKNKIY